MSDQFVGQLLLVGFNFPPVGWATAAGQLLPISQNTALFSLLGTYYGGNGTSNFGLPNLQGNCAVGQGQGPGLSYYSIGEIGGTTTVTLFQTEVPTHNHQPMGRASLATQTSPSNNAFAEATEAGNIYSTTASPLTGMASGIVSPVGGNLPHNNVMSYLTLNWIIAMQGVFPTRG